MAVRSLIVPATDGFDWINQDMSSSNLDMFDKIACENSSKIITICKIHGLMKPYYMERAELATKLNISLSKAGFWSNIFTTTVTKQTQEFQDTTPKQKGFFLLPGKREDKRKNE